MKFVLIPEGISWLSIFLAASLSFILIGIAIPTGGGSIVYWWITSSWTLLGGLTFLSVYEKIKEEEKKSALLTILNATLLFWWSPLAFAIWKVVAQI